MVTRNNARASLRERGWSLRRAAAELGCTHVHLAYVLSGARTSKRLMGKIEMLGPSPIPFREVGFAVRKSA
jgi:lambda repressor-like predicted transcriptional regulator